jgi:hypothetical protein
MVTLRTGSLPDANLTSIAEQRAHEGYKRMGNRQGPAARTTRRNCVKSVEQRIGLSKPRNRLHLGAEHGASERVSDDKGVR